MRDRSALTLHRTIASTCCKEWEDASWVLVQLPTSFKQDGPDRSPARRVAFVRFSFAQSSFCVMAQQRLTRTLPSILLTPAEHLARETTASTNSFVTSATELPPLSSSGSSSSSCAAAVSSAIRLETQVHSQAQMGHCRVREDRKQPHGPSVPGLKESDEQTAQPSAALEERGGPVGRGH